MPPPIRSGLTKPIPFQITLIAGCFAVLPLTIASAQASSFLGQGHTKPKHSVILARLRARNDPLTASRHAGARELSDIQRLLRQSKRP
jgi:hypothetical protein